MLRTAVALSLCVLLQLAAATVQPAKPQEGQGRPSSQEEMVHFVRRVLADTEDIWKRNFQAAGQHYEPPWLVVFSGTTHTGCGFGKSVTGPFYCPVDRRIYLDLDFFRELREELNSPGDFAQVYVVAHEVGHHVQKLLGIDDNVQAQMNQALRPLDANAFSVRLELQADCLAGIYAYKNIRLEPGDIESGLNAASQIGDDTVQKRSVGMIVPETFTHGTSEQRVRWFSKGLESGQLSACDTFGAATL